VLTTHIDTMVLRALIMPSEVLDMHNEARKWLLSGSVLPLRVSHVAIGEAFNGICTDHRIDCEGRDCALIEFNRLVFSRDLLEVKGIHDTGRYHDMVLALHQVDERLEPNDCLILALAITDDECDSFLTSDPVMAKSTRLRDIAEENGTTILPFGEKRIIRDRKQRYSGRKR
jgi:predicted nucleic acid-binding protein